MKIEKFFPSAVLAPFIKEFMIIESDLEIDNNIIPGTITLFGEKKTAEIIMAVVTINSWNRIGVATHLRPLQKQAPSA